MSMTTATDCPMGRRSPRAPAVLLLLLPALMTASVSSAGAQSAGTKPIHAIAFPPGATATVVDGSVAPSVTVGPDMTDEGSERYSLRARAGQTLTMEIRSGDGRAVFTLVQPSPAMVRHDIIKGAGGVKRWSGKLAKTGDYGVVVFTRGAARTRFKLGVTLR